MGNEQPVTPPANVVKFYGDNLNEHDVSAIDKNTILLVYGYMHRMQKLLNNKDETVLNIIPDDIINKCLLYYYIAEYFKYLGYGIKFGQDEIKSYIDATTIVSGIYNNVMQNMLYTPTGNTSYGNITIKSSQTEYIYRWNLKTSHETFIGITTNTLHYNRFIRDTTSATAYYFDTSNHCIFRKVPDIETTASVGMRLDSYPQTLNQPTKYVLMELDLEKKVINFYKNNDKGTKIWANIKCGEDINYHLAVSMMSNTSITLISFDKEIKTQES